jgi:hypothetical protein
MMSEQRELAALRMAVGHPDESLRLLLPVTWRQYLTEHGWIRAKDPEGIWCWMYGAYVQVWVCENRATVFGELIVFEADARDQIASAELIPSEFLVAELLLRQCEHNGAGKATRYALELALDGARRERICAPAVAIERKPR